MGFLFLSHSNADDVAAEAVRDWLIAQGHDSIFLDHHAQDGIVGGEVWEERLYTELRRCRALAALLSRSGSNLLGAPLKSVMPRRSRRESYRSWLPASMKTLSTSAFRPRFAACRLLTGAMRTLKNGFARRLPVPVLIREAQAFGEGIEIRIPASRPLAAPIRRSISAATRRSPIFWRCSTRAARYGGPVWCWCKELPVRENRRSCRRASFRDWSNTRNAGSFFPHSDRRASLSQNWPACLS